MTPVTSPQVNSSQVNASHATGNLGNKTVTVQTGTEQNVGLCAKISAVFASIGNFFANLFTCFGLFSSQNNETLTEKNLEVLTDLPKTPRQENTVDALTLLANSKIEPKPASGIVAGLDLASTDTAIANATQTAEQAAENRTALQGAVGTWKQETTDANAAIAVEKNDSPISTLDGVVIGRNTTSDDDDSEAPATVANEKQPIRAFEAIEADGKLEVFPVKLTFQDPINKESAVTEPQQGSHKETAVKAAAIVTTGVLLAGTGYLVYNNQETLTNTLSDGVTIAKDLASAGYNRAGSAIADVVTYVGSAFASAETTPSTFNPSTMSRATPFLNAMRKTCPAPETFSEPTSYMTALSELASAGSAKVVYGAGVAGNATFNAGSAIASGVSHAAGASYNATVNAGSAIADGVTHAAGASYNATVDAGSAIASGANYVGGVAYNATATTGSAVINGASYAGEVASNATISAGSALADGASTLAGSAYGATANTASAIASGAINTASAIDNATSNVVSLTAKSVYNITTKGGGAAINHLYNTLFASTASSLVKNPTLEEILTKTCQA